jgi:Ser/Thr protein kinase RdoA (MazF antagonist)
MLANSFVHRRPAGIAEEAQINKAVEAALRTKVTRHSRIARGITNLVYKVETRDGVVVLKLFRNKDWPEGGKLEWTEHRLSEENIPHARMLYLSRGDAIFPDGYAIYEYIEGEEPEILIREGRLTIEEFCERLGALLRRIHQIKFQRYGYINRGDGTNRDFIGRRLEDGRDDVDTLRRFESEDQMLYLRARARVEESLKPLGHYYAPVLTHGDPNPKNCIWMKDGQLVLVDWDNAASSLWIRDYAHLTYLCLKRASPETAGEYMSKVRDSFFRGYGEIDFSSADLALMERAWHIIWAHNALPCLRQSGVDDFIRTRDYLLSLLA